MLYAEFFTRFGGSYRAKHTEKRGIKLSQQTELPKGFIRLCPWEAEYLFVVAYRARAGIVEIGRRHGGSAFLMSCAAPDVPLWSIDNAPRDDERLRRYFEGAQVGQAVHLIIGDSQTAQYPEIANYDLLFVDGDHSYDGCLRDLQNWYPKLLDGGHIILHDAHRVGGVQDAIIDFLKEHPSMEVVQPPYIGASYWMYPAGSLAHLIKRS
jgi:predicted O-methyltransferase YrrM